MRAAETTENVFVGHEFLAFALVAALARWRGAPPERAVSLGVVGACAALVPDVDVAYGAASAALLTVAGAPPSWEGFWVVSNAVHRVVTHPLAVGALGALALASVATLRRRRDARGATLVRPAGAAALAAVALLAFAARQAGAAGIAVMSAYLAGLAVLGWVAARRTDHAPRALGGAAALGLLSHPFGDLFMASPPPLLAPLPVSVLPGRIAFAADPTVNLLCVLFVELAAVWAGVGVYARLRGASVRTAIAPRAALGAGYAVAVVVLPRPTMVEAGVFGFTIVPLSMVGLTTLVRQRSGRAWFRAVCTGTATLTVAGVAYLLAYLA